METVVHIWDDIKNVIAWAFIGLLGVISWFFKEKNKQHTEMFDHYNNSKDVVITVKILEEKLNKVENDGKRFWKEHELNMANNQSLLMQKLDSYCDKQCMIDLHLKEQLHEVKESLDKLREQKADKV